MLTTRHNRRKCTWTGISRAVGKPDDRPRSARTPKRAPPSGRHRAGCHGRSGRYPSLDQDRARDPIRRCRGRTHSMGRPASREERLWVADALVQLAVVAVSRTSPVLGERAIPTGTPTHIRKLTDSGILTENKKNTNN